MPALVTQDVIVLSRPPAGVSVHFNLFWMNSPRKVYCISGATGLTSDI